METFEEHANQKLIYTRLLASHAYKTLSMGDKQCFAAQKTSSFAWVFDSGLKTWAERTLTSDGLICWMLSLPISQPTRPWCLLSSKNALVLVPPPRKNSNTTQPGFVNFRKIDFLNFTGFYFGRGTDRLPAAPLFDLNNASSDVEIGIFYKTFCVSGNFDGNGADNKQSTDWTIF